MVLQATACRGLILVPRSRNTRGVTDPGPGRGQRSEVTVSEPQPQFPLILRILLSSFVIIVYSSSIVYLFINVFFDRTQPTRNSDACH